MRTGGGLHVLAVEVYIMDIMDIYQRIYYMKYGVDSNENT